MSNNDGAFGDNFGEIVEKIEPIKPLFTVSKADMSKWLKNAFPTLMKRNLGYFEEIKESLKLYKGQIIERQKSQANARTVNDMDPLLEKARNAKLYDNKIYDLVEFRVTTHNSDKPGIDISQANIDYQDRIGATLAKAVVESINYKQDEDKIEREALRMNFLCGEHYVGVVWDPEEGDINPSWAEAAEQTEGDDIELPGADADSKPTKLSKDKPLKNGDVVYRQFPAWKVLPEPVEVWDKVTWLLTWDLEYVDCVKKQYPRKKDQIKALSGSENIEGFDINYLRRLREEDKIIVLKLFAKRSEYLKEGRYVVALADGTILEDRDSPYEHDELPLQRITDMDLPGELRGRSFLRNLKGLQYQQYFLTSMTAANLRLMGYPKWCIEQGSVNVSDLTNARTVIQKRANSADPKIIQPNPTPPEVYNQIDMLDKKMDKKVKGEFASSETMPARIDSALAMQFLDDKDIKRNHTMVSKVNAFRVSLTQLVIKVAGQFYKTDDERVLNVVGKNHENDIKFFNFANFNRPYVVRVRSGSALPDQKSARLAYILQINKEAPGIITPEQLTDILDLGSVDKFVDIATKSLRAAESIIQDLLTGNPVPEPEGYEDVMAYWKTFATYIQDRQFKESVPPEQKQKVLDYLMGIEALMLHKSMNNMAFAQQLQSLALYPLVFTLPEPPPPPPMAGQPAAPGAEQQQPQETPGQAAQAEAQAGHELDGEMVHAASDLVQHSVPGGSKAP